MSQKKRTQQDITKNVNVNRGDVTRVFKDGKEITPQPQARGKSSAEQKKGGS